MEEARGLILRMHVENQEKNMFEGAAAMNRMPKGGGEFSFSSADSPSSRI